jgi:TatD DNase family protein
MVGETGLDKTCDTNFNEQQRVFHAQAIIAEENNCALIIHSVKTYNEVLKLRIDMQPAMPWILHGYNGNLQQTEQLSQHGFLFSFGKLIFDEGSKATDSFKRLPLEKVFFETDEYSGGIENIYRAGAEIKKIDLNFLKEEIWNNFSVLEKLLLSRF